MSIMAFVDFSEIEIELEQILYLLQAYSEITQVDINFLKNFKDENCAISSFLAHQEISESVLYAANFRAHSLLTEVKSSYEN